MAIGDEWDAVDDATPWWLGWLVALLGGAAFAGLLLLCIYIGGTIPGK